MGHIKVIGVGAFLVLGGINAGDGHGNAQPPQGLDIDVRDGQHVILALHKQNVEGERGTGSVGQNAVLHGPSCLFQQACRLADAFAVGLGPVRNGQSIAFERTGKQAVGKGGKQRLLAPFGRRARRHAQDRIGKIRGDARLHPAGQGLVDEFEIEGLDQGFAHAPVGKDFAPRVEHESVDARGALMRDFRQNHIARLHCREGIVAGPGGGVRLAVAGDVTGLERLEHHAAIAEVIIAHFIEVMLAAVEGQIGPPPVGVPDIRDVPARLERANNIGARPDNGVQRRDGEILAVPLRLFQDRPQAQDQRQLAVFGVEGEPDGARTGLFGLGDLGPGRGVARAAFCAQSLEGPQHIFRGNRASVRESGPVAQGEGDKTAGLVRLDRFGQQTVQRERFAVRPPHKCFNGQR